MTAGNFPVEVLRDQAAAHVEQVRGALAQSGALVAVELAASAPPFPEGPKALAWSLAAVLARRARKAAELGPEHVLHATDGRVVLAVPAGAREAVVEALRGDGRVVMDATGDAVAVDVAWRELPEGALEATGEGSAVAALEALLEQDLARARLRRAEGAPSPFWTPDAPAPEALRELLEQPELAFGQGAAWLARPDAGAPVAVARLDLDNMGRALRAVAEGKPAMEGLRDRFALLAAIQVARAQAERAAQAAGGSLIALPGGDLLLVGAWPELVDLALAVRDAMAPYLAEVVRGLGGDKAARHVDLSAGAAVGAPGAPLATLWERAEAELRRAKGVRHTRHGDRRKAAFSSRGVAVGWDDLRIASDVGCALGDALIAGQAKRGGLRRLAVLHALWRRAEEALEAGAPRVAAAASKRRWLWALQLGRPGAGLGATGATPLAGRLAKLALENVDDGAPGAPRRTEQDAAAWLGLVAEIAAERAHARREERG